MAHFAKRPSNTTLTYPLDDLSKTLIAGRRQTTSREQQPC
jgi:hypothetical protein